MAPGLLLAGAFGFIVLWIQWSVWCPPVLPPSIWPGGNICALTKWAYDWQQLLGSVLALSAAFIGAYYLRRQIKLAEDQEIERQRRRFAAARAVLPLTLSGLSRYSANCAAMLERIHAQAQGQRVPPAALVGQNLPALPSGLADSLQGMIEASDVETGSAVGRLLSVVQYQSSRLQDLVTISQRTGRRVVVVVNIEDYLIDAAEILARVNALFGFARRETDWIPIRPTRQNMHSALFLLNIDDSAYPNIYETVNRRVAKYPPE